MDNLKENNQNHKHPNLKWINIYRFTDLQIKSWPLNQIGFRYESVFYFCTKKKIRLKSRKIFLATIRFTA